MINRQIEVKETMASRIFLLSTAGNTAMKKATADTDIKGRKSRSAIFIITGAVSSPATAIFTVTPIAKKIVATKQIADRILSKPYSFRGLPLILIF